MNTPTGKHGGHQALEVAIAHGVERMFTLSGAHVFPLYDAAVKNDPPLPLIDVRHEQSAVFAAEATAKLTRRPGLAVLTAGPGVTNGISAITQSSFNGVPVLVIGGRAPAGRWGAGALQELDHPPLVASVTRFHATAHTSESIAATVDSALVSATTAHRGPAFVDVPMDVLFAPTMQPVADVGDDDNGEASTEGSPGGRRAVDRTPDTDALADIAELLSSSERPVLVMGSDVWTDGAEVAALAFAEAVQLPVITNGMGRGLVPRGHPLLVAKARGKALGEADLVIVAGTPLDFRLGYGRFGGRAGAPVAKVVHIADSPGQVAQHADLAASVSGDLGLVFTGLHEAWTQVLRHSDTSEWSASLAAAAAAGLAKDAELLQATSSAGVHPARIYGELLPLLADDAVVIGDGGDFVSWAGRFVEPARPGCWLDPGPYGCLGAGLGAAIGARLARPSAQVVLLLGDGAAGLSLMDVDTLVRHKLPILIVVGNNGMWGLEKGPMQMLYGYDVAADLRQETRYDTIVEALGGAGETVSSAENLATAFHRGFASDVPYLVNVLMDPAVPYPRSTFGI